MGSRAAAVGRVNGQTAAEQESRTTKRALLFRCRLTVPPRRLCLRPREPAFLTFLIFLLMTFLIP